MAVKLYCSKCQALKRMTGCRDCTATLSCGCERQVYPITAERYAASVPKEGK
jgi:hypothetical protein